MAIGRRHPSWHDPRVDRRARPADRWGDQRGRCSGCDMGLHPDASIVSLGLSLGPETGGPAAVCRDGHHQDLGRLDYRRLPRMTLGETLAACRGLHEPITYRGSLREPVGDCHAPRAGRRRPVLTSHAHRKATDSLRSIITGYVAPRSSRGSGGGRVETVVHAPDDGLGASVD